MFLKFNTLEEAEQARQDQQVELDRQCMVKNLQTKDEKWVIICPPIHTWDDKWAIPIVIDLKLGGELVESIEPPIEEETLCLSLD